MTMLKNMHMKAVNYAAQTKKLFKELFDKVKQKNKNKIMSNELLTL